MIHDEKVLQHHYLHSRPLSFASLWNLEMKSCLHLSSLQISLYRYRSLPLIATCWFPLDLGWPFFPPAAVIQRYPRGSSWPRDALECTHGFGPTIYLNSFRLSTVCLFSPILRQPIPKLFLHFPTPDAKSSGDLPTIITV